MVTIEEPRNSRQTFSHIRFSCITPGTDDIFVVCVETKEPTKGAEIQNAIRQIYEVYTVPDDSQRDIRDAEGLSIEDQSDNQYDVRPSQSAYSGRSSASSRGSDLLLPDSSGYTSIQSLLGSCVDRLRSLEERLKDV